jgi:hypothetical protein
MIKGVFIINNHGMVRLSRFFLPTVWAAHSSFGYTCIV